MDNGNILRFRNGNSTNAMNASASNATTIAEADTDWVCLDSSMDDATTNSPLLIDKDITSAVRDPMTVIEGPTKLGNFDAPAAAAATGSASGNIGAADGGNKSSMASASSTAYAFTGSALASRTITNLNDILDSVLNEGGGQAANNSPAPTTSASTLTSATTNNTNNNNINTNIIFSGFGSTTNGATTTTGNGSGANGGLNADDAENSRVDDSLYECNICLDTAKDAVVSMCGHLFCWPCLHQWLETRPNRKLCPVCKAAVDKDKVIPLYGRNSVNQEDPRNKVPPRPAGQRTEPEPQPGFGGFGFGDGFHMSFGIGAFPFGFFTSSLNFEPRPPAATRGTNQYQDEQALSKLFLYLAFMCIAWLLFA